MPPGKSSRSDELVPSTHPPLSRSETLLPFSPLDSVSTIAFTPDSSIVFVASWDSTLTIYNLIPQLDQKRGQVGPSFQFTACIITPAPITAVLTLSNTCAVIGLVSGQVCIVDTTIPTQPKLSLFYTCSAPILSMKHNIHHDIVIIIDFSSSLFVFHRLQFAAMITILQKPLFTHIIPFLAQRINSNDLGIQIRVPQEQQQSEPTFESSYNINTTDNNNGQPIQPYEISPRYPIALDTYHDFCIIALPHSFDVYQINIASHSNIDPALVQTISLYSNTASLNGNNNTINHQQHRTITTNTTTTTTQPLSGTALNTYLRSLSVTLTKFASYHSPVTAQLTSLQILPHTLQVTLGTDTNTVITKRIGFVVGSLEGRAGVDYITISTLPSSEQKVMTQEDEKRRFAFKCHRTILNDGSKSSDNVLYAVNDVSPHPRAAAFATCGGDGTIVIWSESLKKRICSFGNKLFPIQHVVFSPNGQYIMWVESPVYNAMDDLEKIIDGVHPNHNSTNTNTDSKRVKSQISQLNRTLEFGYSNAENFTAETLPNVMDPIDSVELENIMFEESDALLLGGGAGQDQITQLTQKSDDASALLRFFNGAEPIGQYKPLHQFFLSKGFQPEQIDRWFETRTISDKTRHKMAQINPQNQKSDIIQPLSPANKYRLFIRVVSDQMVYPRGSK